MVLPDDACFFFLYTGIVTLDKRDLNIYLMQSIGRTMGLEYLVFYLMRASYINVKNHKFGCVI